MILNDYHLNCAWSKEVKCPPPIYVSTSTVYYINCACLIYIIKYPVCIFSKITVHSGPGLYFRRVKLILPEEAQGFMAGGWAVLNCILRC